MSLSTFGFAHTDLRKGVTGVWQDSLSRRVVVYRSRKLYPPWNYILRWIQVRKKEKCCFTEVLVITSEWPRQNWEEEINLRYLVDKSTEVGELNLRNKERGTMSITSSFHRETRKWGGSSYYTKRPLEENTIWEDFDLSKETWWKKNLKKIFV